MNVWALVAAAYGLVLAVAALTQPIKRRAVALAAVLAYTLVSLGLGTVAGTLWTNLVIPGALLVTGYWLSGLFFRDPQAWLESWLLDTDRAVNAQQWMERLPRPLAHLLELSYAADYVVVGGGAIYAATFGAQAVTDYWTLVLAAALASYAPLPWLRSRPPRAIEKRDVSPAKDRTDGDRGMFRRFNLAVLNNTSIQANTLPSGHVSAAVAAAFGVMAVDPMVGWGLLGVAGVIAIAAIAGRYHYVVDCAAGAALALVFWSLM